jgi:YidC/Oxa1 family membrane protein insertase
MTRRWSWSTAFCGFCTFPALINVLVDVAAVFPFVLRDWGLAIIALVCGCGLLHPITKRSQVNDDEDAEAGAGDGAAEERNLATTRRVQARRRWSCTRSVGFTPVLGCLPMFLQMPIFIALWRALQTTFELRQAPFLYFFGSLHVDSRFVAAGLRW